MNKRSLFLSAVLPYTAIGAVGFLIYSNAFHASFHFDDIHSIAGNGSIYKPFNIKAIFDYWPPRFLTNLTFAFNYRLGGLEVWGYHLFNILVHIGTSLLVYWLVRLVLRTPFMADKEMAKSPVLFPFLAALLFLTHPIQTQAVTYIVQRTASLAAFFYLLSLCCYIESRFGEKKTSLFYTGCILSMVLAMFSKEYVITLPAMIVLCEVYFLKGSGNLPWKKLSIPLLGIFVIPLTILLTHAMDIRLRVAPPGISSWHYLLTQLRVIVTYLRLLFIPTQQHLDYDYPIFTSFFQLPVLLSATLLALLLVFAFKLYSKHRLLSFSILWFFLTLLPESGLIPIQDVIFEHRLYLPMAGFALAVSYGLYIFLARRSLKAWVVVMILLAGTYGYLTYERNFVWKDELTLWEDVVEKSPKNARAYNNRGYAYQSRSLWDQSLSDFDKAIQIEPDYPNTYYNRGISRQSKGLLDQAFSDFDKAIQLRPDYADAYSNRGVLYQSQGLLDQAILDFNKALEIRPDLAEVYYNRGNVYRAKGLLDQAISDYDKTVQIQPDFARAYNNRGASYQSKGHLDQAILDYDKAVQLKPGYVEAYNNRGNAYQAKGFWDQAISDYNKTIQIDPDLAEAYYNRSNAYQSKGLSAQAVSDYNKAVQIKPALAKASE